MVKKPGEWQFFLVMFVGLILMFSKIPMEGINLQAVGAVLLLIGLAAYLAR